LKRSSCRGARGCARDRGRQSRPNDARGRPGINPERRGTPEAERASADNAGARVLGGSGLTRDRSGGFRYGSSAHFACCARRAHRTQSGFGDSRQTPRRMRSSVH
jgi:hypothetical protein